MSQKLHDLVEKAVNKPKDREAVLALATPPDFGPGETKQSFKDSTDVNKILKKAQRAGGISHVLKYPEAEYGQFDGEMDLLTASTRIKRAQEIFDDLPSEVKQEFSHDALAFVDFANQPENVGRLAELIPAIAEPGRYFPNPVVRGGQGAGLATAPSEPSSAASEAPSAVAPPPAAEAPSGASEG